MPAPLSLHLGLRQLRWFSFLVMAIPSVPLGRRELFELRNQPLHEYPCALSISAETPAPAGASRSLVPSSAAAAPAAVALSTPAAALPAAAAASTAAIGANAQAAPTALSTTPLLGGRGARSQAVWL